MSVVYTPDSIIKFADVICNIGVKGLNNFISSGIFKAEVAGLYIVAATVNSETINSEFSINKNSQSIAYVTIAGTGNNDQSGTGVVVTQLAVEDRISIKALYGSMEPSMTIYGIYSTLIIVKIN